MVKENVQIDKIASVTKNIGLRHEEELTNQLSCTMGTVLTAEVLEDKKLYNTLELPSGRMSLLKKGDIIACALGQRMALKGFAGRLPGSLKVNDTIHLLNAGGVAGICTSANLQEVGEPLRIRVLGGISRQGNLLNINDKRLFNPLDIMKSDTPLIITTGTSMDSGKTTVAAEIIKTLTRIGMKLAGTKVTGVGLQRDTYKMQDYGVRETVSFVDCGITSTANLDEQTVIGIAKGAIEHLSLGSPDAIVVEFGDGLLGHYGVAAILRDKQIQANVRLHVGCARDPVGAIMLARECAAMGLPLDIISGPVTDNQVGQDLVREHIPGILTYNAFHPQNDWLDLVIKRWSAAA